MSSGEKEEDSGLDRKRRPAFPSDRLLPRYQYSGANLDNLDEIKKVRKNRINMHKSIAYYCEYAIITYVKRGGDEND